MSKKSFFIMTESADPYHNLALEEVLLHTVGPEERILYLWQNERTVVIGRNQNAGAECRISLLEAEGGHLARRLSGGGAVYHDLGNLNFTFLMPSRDFDVPGQTDVILRAVRGLGIPCEKNGRNDLTADGKKFSGHAYYHGSGNSYHHGTLMLRVEKEPLERYLTVSPLKLSAKGVSSVRSRVTNLCDFRADLTVDKMKEALLEAFSKVYGMEPALLREEDLDQSALKAAREKYASPEWKYGTFKPLENSREARFSWGTVRVDFTVREGKLLEAALWSDAVEADYITELGGMLMGLPAGERELAERLTAGLSRPELIQIANDVAGLIAGEWSGQNEI